MAIQVKLEAFEGPLDLLLHLIDKNEASVRSLEKRRKYLLFIKKRFLDKPERDD